MSEETNRVEVKVGAYRPDGTFIGEVIRFEQSWEEVGSWTDHAAASSGDDRGVTYTLYRRPDGRYRVHEFTWSRRQGEESEAYLYPMEADEEPKRGRRIRICSRRWGCPTSVK